MAGKMEAAESGASTGAASLSEGALSTEPAAATPGRVSLLDSVVEKFVEGLKEAGSYERFTRCYQKFYKLQPELARCIYDQFVSQLHSSINAEVQELKEEGNLEVLLDSLDKLQREGGNATDLQWRPSGIPEEDIHSHLVPYLLKQREYLHRLLAQQQQENARLAQSVLAGREKIVDMQREVARRQQAWQDLSRVQRELVLSVLGPMEGI